jgi:hypothetical protein
MFFPESQSFGDLRPFFLLTIAAWAVLWIAPRTRGRPVFVGLALALFWLWMLGEAAGLDAYSAAPIPSPPYMTLTDFESANARPTQVTIDDLDPSDSELYSLAQNCNSGDYFACDQLAAVAPSGSDFETFGRTCGGIRGGADAFGGCQSEFGDDSFGGDDEFGDFEETPLGPSVFAPTAGVSDDKTLEIGLVSTLIAAIYLVGLVLLDRKAYRGLATAFVVPAILALVSGVSSLGDWSGELFAGGFLAFSAGVVLGFIGQVQRRRFTTWFGGLLAAVGTLLIALDAASIDSSVDSVTGDVKLIGPGLLVIVFGGALVGVAWAIAWYTRRNEPPADDEAFASQPAPGPTAPEPVDLSPPGWSPPTPDY